MLNKLLPIIRTVESMARLITSFSPNSGNNVGCNNSAPNVFGLGEGRGLHHKY